MNSPTFISIGECMAELQLAEAGLYSLGFGGDTLNTAWYVRALNPPKALEVAFYTAVGSDRLSNELLQFFSSHDIETQFIKQITDRNLGLYLISLRNAEREFTYWRSASAAKLLAEDGAALRVSLSNAQYIYFSGITIAILEPHHRERFLGIMRDMKDLGKNIAFDSNVRRKLWPSDDVMRATVVEGYKVATLALPTFDDDRMLFGDTYPIDCARRIAGYGVKEVVVKNGAEACIVMTDEDCSAVPPAVVPEIVDTTGAGDSFNAGYITARIRGMAPFDAAKFAHVVAGRVIGGRGALLDMEIFSDLAQ